MIDHLSSNTKMFNLVVQEERQCAIGSRSSSPTNSLAFQAMSFRHHCKNPPLLRYL